jgi:hypothetical protein
MTRCLLIACLLGLAPAPGAESLVLAATHTLDPQLASADSNWHPQGLGFDEYTGELLFIQQASDRVYVCDLIGTVLNVRVIGPITYNPGGATATVCRHTTSVAADATNYYVSDYTNNSTGYDMQTFPKAAGAATPFSNEVAAYGGYPIDIRGTTLYKCNVSTTYSWNNLNQLRTVDLASPDVVLTQDTLSGTAGIGDIAIDLDGMFVWVLEYLPSASIHTFDLATAALVDTFPLGLDGETAGLTYHDNVLYYYDWDDVAGSELQVYDVIRPAAIRVVDATDGTVVAGLGGYPVTMSVENLGTNAVNVTTVDLTFTGSADRTSEYTVTPDPANPTSLAPGSTETFTFGVDVQVGATLETITIDGTFQGTDAVSAGTVEDTAADVTDTWDVVACLAPLCGDCNLDGQLSILDALVGAQHAAGLVTLTAPAYSSCNVIGLLEPDPGADVDILDALTVAQVSAGIPGIALACC